MLPLGRKNARRCTECQITCHASCAHLVPDLCGMPMEVANELLRNWKEINRGKQQPKSGRPALREATDALENRMDRLALEPERESYGEVDAQDMSRFEEIADPGMPEPGERIEVSTDQYALQPHWEGQDYTRSQVQSVGITLRAGSTI